MSARSDRRRRAATAVWLAGVASNRPGVIQRVARCFGSLDEALDVPLPRLRAAIAGSRGPFPGSAPGPAASGEGRTARGRARGQGQSTRGEGRGPAAAGAASQASRAQEAARDASRFGQALAASLPEESPPAAGSRVVTFDDELYPPSLRLLFDPPPALFVAGDDVEQRLRGLATSPAVAVVGTRAPSSYGREMARLLGADLARAGVVVVSGVALGIDVCAQVAALEAAAAGVGSITGVPPSVGVLGCGIDIVHPRSNAGAFRALRRQGLLVTEFWPGTPPSVWRFPARNRVIAGLSRAVVVVEGSRRSGSRITAELALEASREILAVPGEAGRRLSEAPHRLLRHGAHLCEAADDVLAVLGLERTFGGARRAGDREEGATANDADDAAADGGGQATDGGEVAGSDLAADARAVFGALRDAPGAAEELAARSGLEARAVAAAVTALELEGLVARGDGGVYRLLR